MKEENYYLVEDISNQISASMIEKASFFLTSYVDSCGKEFFSEKKLESILPKDIILHIKNNCSRYTLNQELYENNYNR